MMIDNTQIEQNPQQNDLKETVGALAKAVVTLAEVIAQALRKFAEEVGRIIERMTRGFLAARLARRVGPRVARWLAQRWPRRWLPTRSVWRWAIKRALGAARA